MNTDNSDLPSAGDHARQSAYGHPADVTSGSGPGAPGGRISPRIQALITALADLDDPGRDDSESQAWGTSGLGVEQVSEADIDSLARLHHQLTAQIGRLIRGPVASSTATTVPNASSLVPPPSSDGAMPERESAPDPTSAPGPDPHADSSVPGDADGDGPALPFGAQTALVRRGWPPGQARTVIVASRFASRYPELDQMWRAGDISAEAVLTLHKTCRQLDSEQETAFMNMMFDHLHDLTYSQLRRLTRHLLDLVSTDSIDTDEDNAYRSRSLTFSTLGDTVMFQGQLPKLEGQAFLDTIAAIVEQQRAEADALTPGQRKADALTALVVNSSLTGNTPALGGLPVAVTLTLTTEQAEQVATRDPDSSGARREDSGAGPEPGPAPDGPGNPADPDPLLNPGRNGRASYPDGDPAADASTRFTLCCAEVTPIYCTDALAGAEPAGPHEPTGPVGSAGAGVGSGAGAGSARPSSFLNRLLHSRLLPLAVGRTQRLATPAQRKALAIRDGGCLIPGCDVPPNRTQPHHVTDFSLGGPTDLDNLASLCWVHHRQVDHGYWKLTPNPEPGIGPHWCAERIDGPRR